MQARSVHKRIAVYKQGWALLHRVIWLVLRNESRCAPLLEVRVDELTVLVDDQPTDRPNKSKHNDALEGRPCENFTVADRRAEKRRAQREHRAHLPCEWHW